MNKTLNYIAIPGIPKTTNRERSRLFRIFDPTIIINTSCEYFKLPLERLQVKCRKREVVFPRHVIMFFLTEYTDLTFKQIAGIFHQDHTSAIHGKSTVIDLMESDETVRDRIDELKKQIANNH